MDGIINLIKPQGITSHTAVSKIRRILNIKKAGHTGTLDPMVTGVLPICTGNATRIIEYMDESRKIYQAELLLGLRSDTQDIWGTILNEDLDGALKISDKSIFKCINGFCGDIMQTPPSYSAVSVAGKRLYQYAREGIIVEVKKRPVTIFSIENILIERKEKVKISFLVECSRGTYVRTLCNDIGNELGCGGTMTNLVRVQSGIFKIEDAFSFDEIEKNDFKFLLPDFPLQHMPKINIRLKDSVNILMNGGYVEFGEVLIDDCEGNFEKEFLFPLRVYYKNNFIAIAEITENKKIKAKKVLNRENF